MKLRKRIGALALIFAMGIAVGLLGCKTNTVTAPLAPGYLNATDQKMGQDLAALNGFVLQEKANYAALPAAAQATEKPVLNDLITATDLANASYQAYHAGTQTQGQVQTAIAAAQAKQNALVVQKEAH